MNSLSKKESLRVTERPVSQLRHEHRHVPFNEKASL